MVDDRFQGQGGHLSRVTECPLTPKSRHQDLDRQSTPPIINLASQGRATFMAEARVERRLTAIFAGDVAGYSRLMGIDEEGTLARLNAHRREFLDPKISEHRGRIVKRTGDGILIEFASAVDAARCAVEVQRGMTERNAPVPSEKRIELRISMLAISLPRKAIFTAMASILPLGSKALLSPVVSAYPTMPTGRCVASSTPLSRMAASKRSRILRGR